MQNLKILNNKEVKRILKELKEIYGAEVKFDYAFFQSSKGKIYLLSKKFGELNDKNLRINNLGMYFAKIEKGGLRLSIEGAQMIKPKKNIIEIDDKDVEKWMAGEDLKLEGNTKHYVIIKNKKDILGVGKHKEDRILNYVAKDRRIKSSKAK